MTWTLATSPTISLTTFAFLYYIPATVAFFLFLQNMLTPFLPQKLCVCYSFRFDLIFPGLAPSQHLRLNSTIPSSKRPPLTVLGGQHYAEVKSPCWNPTLPSLAVSLWVRYLIFLCVSFLTCKIGTLTTLTTSLDFCKA